MDYSCADLNGLINVADMRDVPREDIFKLCVSIDATNFLIFVSELVLKVMFISPIYLHGFQLIVLLS